MDMGHCLVPSIISSTDIIILGKVNDENQAPASIMCVLRCLVINQDIASQNLAELLLLCRREAVREVDLVSDDKVTSLARLLRDGHAKTGIPLFSPGLGRTGFVQVQLLALDGCDGPLPTRQSLLEVESDGMYNVVVLALEEWVLFLQNRQHRAEQSLGVVANLPLPR